jgi:hypothetical protein
VLAMRDARARCRATASRGLFIRAGERRCKGLHHAAVLVIAVCAATLVGCAEYPYDDYDISPTASKNTERGSRARMPDRALLTAQPEPDCEVKPTASDAAKSAEQSDPKVGLALRIKLEYEKECYRKAEVRVRDRLKRLQASTAELIRAEKRFEQNDR